ncbi:hypothetical protein [Nocardia sp. XZ_19_369]|uniref:hypothetical protein n=1 Tax=Nocardia sp. XZ_19_369 TaxID=2769487 RepID=UPI00188ECC47|nr:hypothetical protein [Nocardia sp. XZ_19_369]
MTPRYHYWYSVTDLMNANTQVPHRIGTYLRRTGWTPHPETGWAKTVDGTPVWLPAIPADPEDEVPPLPTGVVNGLVNRQITELLAERDTTVIEVLLRLEAIEQRSWTQIWTDINGPAAIPTPAGPTLTEQAATITAELADLHAYTGIGDDSPTSTAWPWVAIDLSADEVITARPTLPREVPDTLEPADCWSIDTRHAPALHAMTHGHLAAHTATAFTAITLRAIVSHARAQQPATPDHPPSPLHH